MDDIIRLKGMTLFGYYGVSKAEREIGQKIQVDLELHADLRAACRSDDLADTINYEAVYARVVEAASRKKHRLLESLGEDICDAVLHSFPVSRVVVTLRKTNLPFPNSIDYVEVVLAREATV
jgi:dihydroneopterin aldolase